MSPVRLRAGACAALALVLAACAAPRVKPLAADAALLAGQLARERALAARADWQLLGRLGISDGQDSGSGTLDWTQQGPRFRFSVHAPVTGKTWVLVGDAAHARLEGLREHAVEGNDAAALLQRELGWQVPLAELVDWVRGMRAPGPARIEFRSDGLPASLQQAGWTVEYPAYDESRDPPLPSKVFASKGHFKVRLAIRQWTLQ